MIDLSGTKAVVTGGTDGIGAATALRLYRHGADVTIIGRSQAKADTLTARAAAEPGPGSLQALVADFSRMATVDATVDTLARTHTTIDLLVHAVGILITRTEHTSEGIEKDFAVGYLSRFVFLEAAARHGLLHAGTRMVNIAASAPKVPFYARMEFSDLAEVEARVGMRSHGQAQLANDLLLPWQEGPLPRVRLRHRRRTPAGAATSQHRAGRQGTRPPPDTADGHPMTQALILSGVAGVAFYAHAMQQRAKGRASRRSRAIGCPHRSQIP